MAGLTVTERNAILTWASARYLYASLHTADPGTSGTSEVTGGSPAYVRVVPTWGTAANGQITSSACVWNVPAGTYTHVGFWSAVSGGTFYGSIALAVSEVLSPQGTAQATPTLTLA